MKKLVLMLAVAFSMSFVACGNKEVAAETETATDSLEEVNAQVVTAVTCPCGGDSCAAKCGDSCKCADDTVVAVAIDAQEVAVPAEAK